MEISTQHLESKYLNAEGKTGLVTKLKNHAYLKGIFQMNFSDKAGRKIDDIANEYRFCRMIMDKQTEGSKEKFKGILMRIKKRAKSQIIKDMCVTDDHMELFGFRNSDFSKEISFRRLIIDFIISSAERDEFFKDAIKEHAKDGHAVDFSFANAFKRKYNEILELSRKSLEDEPELVKEHRSQELFELSNLINIELNLRNKEKSQRPNLCYFVLSDEESEFKWDHEKFNEKINKLSKTNLIEFIRIYCIANNDFYKEDILKERNTKKMEANRKRYKKKRIFTPEETKEFVRLYKEDDLNNAQIAEIIGCSLRTVERYSKQ